jgi:hypothetical protein
LKGKDKKGLDVSTATLFGGGKRESFRTGIGRRSGAGKRLAKKDSHAHNEGDETRAAAYCPVV